jgi:DNA repair exonuclease SbcCD ATPase subunit
MLKIKNITVKNFMSVGNVTQAVHFDTSGLTLVLGNNMDLGGDGSRNGTGKTTIVNALSFALYGNALYNIKKDNLVNKTNNKAMMVTVDFERDGVSYRIERGRKPSIFRFLVNNVDSNEGITDEMQGEGRMSQQAIEKVLGMSHTMFKHIVALNTYTEPFLSMRANEQRDLIEQLLGITQLSEKSEVLKDLIKRNKDAIQEETYRIRGVEEANHAIEKSIADLERRQRVWHGKVQDDIKKMEAAVEALEHLDIDTELALHRQTAEYNEKLNAKNEAQKWLDSLTRDYAKEENRYHKLEKEIKDIEDHKCYACGTKLHDNNQQEILEEKNRQRQECSEHMLSLETQSAEYHDIIAVVGELVKPARPFYDTVDGAMEHRNTVNSLLQQIDNKKSELDPYADQIISLKETGLREIDWNEVNRLNELKEHQEFLMKLLTNKDSFIRKKIIEQNLQFLNTRLEYYITRLGLPHEVQFQSDLSVSITQLGQDLDFDNLSRGERNRLILGLSWSFRDVFESMNHPINFMAIDELVDSGMDTIGVESALGVLKKMERDRNKNILLISHRDELVGRVNNVLQVTKENGFTTFNTEVEIVDA